MGAVVFSGLREIVLQLTWRRSHFGTYCLKGKRGEIHAEIGLYP